LVEHLAVLKCFLDPTLMIKEESPMPTSSNLDRLDSTDASQEFSYSEKKDMIWDFFNSEHTGKQICKFGLFFAILKTNSITMYPSCS